VGWLVISFYSIALTSLLGVSGLQTLVGALGYSTCSNISTSYGLVAGKLCNLLVDSRIFSISTLIPTGSVIAIHVLCNLKSLCGGGSLLKVKVSIDISSAID